MKLLRCKIGSFGALNDFEFDFDKRLDCVCKENGSGKTTFAAFICAMLYGMETSRSNEKGQKDRSRYAPWNGGRFGGALELEAGGRRYRIERTFDRQSAAKDQLKTYDLTSGVEEVSLSPTPGEALLGIGREAFVRTAFMTFRESGSIEGLLPKINSYINGSVDTDIFGRAVAALQKERRKYRPEKGRGGSLEELAELKKAAEKELYLCSASADAAEEHEKQRANAEKKKKEASDRLALASAYADALLMKRTYEEFLKKQNDARTELEEFYARHGEQRMPEEKLEEGKDLLLKIEHYKKRLVDEPLEAGEKAEYYSLKDSFDGNEPEPGEIDEMIARLTQLRADKERLEEAKETLRSEEFKALSAHFDAHCPTNEELTEFENLDRTYNEEKKNYEDYREKLVNAAKEVVLPPKKLPKIGLIAAIAGGVCLLLSVLFFIIEASAAAWVLLLTGIIGLGFAAYSYFTSAKPQAPAVSEDPSVEERYKNAQRAFSDKLNHYGYFGSDLSLLLQNLTEDRARYLERKELFSRAQSSAETLERRVKDNEAAARSFFDRYPRYTSGDETLRLRYLKEDYRKYREIRDKQNAAAENAEKDRAALAACQDELNSLLRPYGEVEDGGERAALQRQKDLLDAEKRLKSARSEREKDARDYLAAHPGVLKLPENVPDEEEKERLQSDVLAYQSFIAQTEKKLEEENRIADRTDEYRAKIRNLEEERQKQTREFFILSSAKEYLELAEKQLLGRYTSPLADAYARYASKIDPALCENVILSASDLSLSFERAGELRKIDSFSSGFCALSDICMRLAMIDVAYPDERPFLVLDDPFVYLDDENLKKAVETLKTISENTQILYFTCHSDRAFANPRENT